MPLHVPCPAAFGAYPCLPPFLSLRFLPLPVSFHTCIPTGTVIVFLYTGFTFCKPFFGSPVFPPAAYTSFPLYHIFASSDFPCPLILCAFCAVYTPCRCPFVHCTAPGTYPVPFPLQISFVHGISPSPYDFASAASKNASVSKLLCFCSPPAAPPPNSLCLRTQFRTAARQSRMGLFFPTTQPQAS